MKSITIDIDKLKKPNSGLGQFCKHLVTALYKIKSSQTSLTLVGSLPALRQLTSLEKATFLETGLLDKWIGVKAPQGIWFATHQEAKFLPRSKKTKVILTIHDLNFLDSYSGTKKEQHLNKVQKLVDRAAAVVFISNYTATVCAANLQFYSTPQYVIHNGVALDLTHKREPVLVLKGQQFLFSIGIFTKKKNFHTLIQMMHHLPNFKMVIAGNNNTSYGKLLKEELLKEGLSERVLLIGEVTEGEKLWLYSHCSCFVFPSLNEGFGLPVLESLSFYKPTVVSRYTSLPEIGGDCVSYFENFEPKHMAETIEKAIFEPINAERITQHLTNFSWDNAAKKYLEVFENIKNT